MEVLLFIQRRSFLCTLIQLSYYERKNLWNKKARWGLSHHHRTAYVLFSHISKKKAQEQEWRLNKLLQDLSPALLTHTSVIRLNCQEPSVKGSDFVQFLLWCQVAANLVFKRNSNRKCEIIEMWGQYQDLKVQVISSNENEKQKKKKRNRAANPAWSLEFQ